MKYEGGSCPAYPEKQGHPWHIWKQHESKRYDDFFRCENCGFKTSNLRAVSEDTRALKRFLERQLLIITENYEPAQQNAKDQGECTRLIREFGLYPIRRRPRRSLEDV